MWGIVLSCFAAVENYSGAIAVRFFLGVFEAAVTPGFALFVGQLIPSHEPRLTPCRLLSGIQEKSKGPEPQFGSASMALLRRVLPFLLVLLVN